MDFLLIAFLGKALWLWLAFLGIVMALLALDLGILHRGNREIGTRESLVQSGVYIALGLGFGGFVWAQLGPAAARDYVTGFVIEKSLAIDNVFVIAMIFSAVAIPRAYQYRVLFWGIVGVIVLRGAMIAAGATLVANFGWTLYIFAGFLIITGIKMWRSAGEPDNIGGSRLLDWLRRRLRVTESLHGDRFVLRRDDRLWVTPLFLALIMVECVDLIFAVDSVPAIFAITTDPYIVYTSNIFAVLGLRALYFALAAMLHRFRYLKYALAVLLVFIGSKIFIADLLGFAGGKFPAAWSLSITFAILSTGIGWSLWKTRGALTEGGASQ